MKIAVVSAYGTTFGPVKELRASGIPAAPGAAPTQDIARSDAGSVLLMWTTPELHGGLAQGYSVFRNTGPTTAISGTADPTCSMETNPAPQECVVSSLTPGTSYDFKVAGITDRGSLFSTQEQLWHKRTHECGGPLVKPSAR